MSDRLTWGKNLEIDLNSNGNHETGSTVQLPTAALTNPFVLIARRWGYVGSVVIRPSYVTNGLATHIVILNGFGEGSKTVISIDTTGLLTVTESASGVFLDIVFL